MEEVEEEEVEEVEMRVMVEMVWKRRERGEARGEEDLEGALGKGEVMGRVESDGEDGETRSCGRAWRSEGAPGVLHRLHACEGTKVPIRTDRR